ncbi:MAG: COX15/CtaA family protein [Actinobacteria bacterium]|nr:COX15/CtaA family protein [Actinomycetota bacterium]
MAATPTRLAGLRARAVSAASFRRLALAALVALFVVIATGAVVRLTASGLGCENWPRCGDTPFPEREFHALVEFGNRVVALFALAATAVAALAARRVRGLPRWVAWSALGAMLTTLAQIPLGGLTVLFELHPLLVMAHFLLALVSVALAALAAVGGHVFARGLDAGAVPRPLRILAFMLVPLCAAVVVTGALVTAAGPHSGGEDIRRLGNLVDAAYVHVRATAVFGLSFAALLVALHRLRPPLRVERGLAMVVVGLLLAQMAVGELQWRNELPWWLVLLHVVLATGVWTGIVALASFIRLRGASRVVRTTG